MIISVGGSRKAVVWAECEMQWSDFVERLKNPVKSPETLNEYLQYPKSKQDDLKDVGGFIGGSLAGGRRKAQCVEGRDLVTLDLDNIPAGKTEDILKRIDGLSCAAAVYSTRKHADYAPRLRIIIPLDKTASVDEYEPVARKLASLIGIEFCDPTTFEANRLMYWPSCCSDSVYVYQIYDKPFCSLEGILNLYSDWIDVTTWPQVPGIEALEKRRLAKQEDPTMKRGIVGAFCRTYTLTEAMDRFIPGMYEETTISGRYTYTGGSTCGGAVVYDGDRFLYSHHATDPCSGQLVNAFDLIRLHKFGEQDVEAKEGTPVNRTPSFLAMKQLALADDKVQALMAKERYDEAKSAFPVGDNILQDIENENWRGSLALDGNGNYKKTINNAILILENDPLLKGKIVTDEFAGCGLVLGSLPWDARDERRNWSDADDAGYYWYLEHYYNLTGKEKLDNALTIVGSRHRINDVKQYLDSLQWDGVKRVETLLQDYLGAEDNPYTRAVMKKSLCAAVARAIEGGVKYDYVPIFTGPQGIGKSTFLDKLGKSWYSDSLSSFEGKDAAEMIQGIWINEIGELTAMSKAETNMVKQFLSKREDIYRAPYGKRTEKHPRRCVFFGTSNESEFLKDATGNRRFWPVDVGLHPIKKSVFEDLVDEEVDQIWAEARAYYLLGEPLYLPKELEVVARQIQENHTQRSGREGIIGDFLEKKVPVNWYKMSLSNRKMFLAGNIKVQEDLIKRDRVCAIEIFVECFGGNINYMKRQDSVEINNILANMDGWKRDTSTCRYGCYGIQRGFRRM